MKSIINQYQTGQERSVCKKQVTEPIQRQQQQPKEITHNKQGCETSTGNKQ